MSERADAHALAATLGDPLIRLAYVLTGDGEEAQDVVQAVFLKLLTSDLGRVENLQAYARRAVTNEVISRARRTRRARKSLHHVAQEMGRVDDAADRVIERERLKQALLSLNPKQRAVLALRYLEDLDDRTIGDMLGCSPATVRSISARALTKLRSQMRDGET
jgi:RNA polymerase sigma factor (sigma-70 family)